MHVEGDSHDARSPLYMLVIHGNVYCLAHYANTRLYPLMTGLVLGIFRAYSYLVLRTKLNFVIYPESACTSINYVCLFVSFF